MAESKNNPIDDMTKRDSPPPGSDPQRPSPELLLWAYRHTLFPMNDPWEDTIEWYSSDPRAIFPLEPPEAFHIPKNIAREMRKKPFEIRSDTAFEQVMRGCATDR